MSSIKVKECNLACGMQIYWSTNDGFYKELETNKRHFCPNFKKQSTTGKTTPPEQPTSQAPQAPQAQKRKMIDSIIIIKGNDSSVASDYKKAAADISKVGGKIHGTQSHVYQEEEQYENSEINRFTRFCVFIYYEYPEIPENILQ